MAKPSRVLNDPEQNVDGSQIFLTVRASDVSFSPFLFLILSFLSRHFFFCCTWGFIFSIFLFVSFSRLRVSSGPWWSVERAKPEAYRLMDSSRPERARARATVLAAWKRRLFGVAPPFF